MLRRTRRFVVLVPMVVAVAACASSAEDSTVGPDATATEAPTLPGPASNGDSKAKGCARSADCPAPPPCEEAACVDGACIQRAVRCSGGTECTPSTCDPATSKCAESAAPDRAACNGGFGQCVAGKCEAVGSCFGDSPQQYLHCDGTNYRDLSTALYPTSRVTTYACADGLAGHEVALEFDPPVGSNVTLTLAVTEGADTDLELIVLEGDCSGVATCAGSSLTAGTGFESVAFVPQPNRKYYAVIDSKVATTTKFRITADCK